MRERRSTRSSTLTLMGSVSLLDQWPSFFAKNNIGPKRSKTGPLPVQAHGPMQVPCFAALTHTRSIGPSKNYKLISHRKKGVCFVSVCLSHTMQHGTPAKSVDRWTDKAQPQQRQRVEPQKPHGPRLDRSWTEVGPTIRCSSQNNPASKASSDLPWVQWVCRHQQPMSLSQRLCARAGGFGVASGGLSLWHASHAHAHAHAMRRANSLVGVTSSGQFCHPQPGLTLVGQL